VSSGNNGGGDNGGGGGSGPDPSTDLFPAPSAAPSGTAGSTDGTISTWVAPSSPAPVGFFVDGVGCTDVQPVLDYIGAPCGRSWNLAVSASCGPLGPLRLQLNSGDGIYPQLCHSVPEIYCVQPASGEVTADLVVKPTGDVFTWSGAQSGCSIDTGPDYDHQSLPITARGTLQDSAGATHTFSYNPGTAGADPDAGL